MVPPKLINKIIHQNQSHFSLNTSKKRNSKFNEKIKKRSLQRRAKRTAKQENICIASAMSAWVENFTMAATWQLKHQVAFWKARAVSLEYENRILHEVIRRNHVTVPTNSKINGELSDSEIKQTAHILSAESSEQSDSESEESETNQSESESENEVNEKEDFEVSEEFIQFLTANAKYREDARREKERLKAKEREEALLVEPRETVEDRLARKKQLYGNNFKKIVALESYLHSDFNDKVDRSKVAYWPNIPFNFNVK